MTVSGVICEYNPFHNGHKYMLDCMREDGSSHIVCIMSGNFVQRGEFALCDKYLRGEMAVKNGADLVIELPLPYSVGTAETFARGSVGMLNKLNCVNRLYFGSESPKHILEDCLNESESDDFKERLKALLDEGLSYPTAYSSALNNPSVDTPNNVLAIEYMKQLKFLNSEIEPRAVIRKGVSHDSNETNETFASASALRRMISMGENYHGFIPENCKEIIDNAFENGELPSDMNKIQMGILSKLRFMNTEDFSSIADVNEGLEFRIEKAVSQGTSIGEISENIKTRRYTNAKIRRIILCAYLGIKKDMQKELPDYINVLACNGKGIEIIKEIKNNSGVKVITKHGEYDQLSEKDKALYDFTQMCDNQFALTLPKVKKCFYNRERKFKLAE